MQKLILNDGRSIEVQSAVPNGAGALHIKLLLQTSDQLKNLFGDEFSNKKISLEVDGKIIKSFENYTKLSYLKENIGGIWEVELLQIDADIETKVAALEVATKENASNLELAIAELTTAFATIVNQFSTSTEEKEEENV